MRIAQVAPPLESVPPARYGGTERVVATLTCELVRRGHDVTLFASADSRTPAHLVPTVDQAVWHHRPPYHDLAPFWSVTLVCAPQLEPSDEEQTYREFEAPQPRYAR